MENENLNLNKSRRLNAPIRVVLAIIINYLAYIPSMVLISIYDSILAKAGVNTENNEWIVLGEDAFIRIGVTISALVLVYLLIEDLGRI